MPFYVIYFLFENNIKEMTTVVSNTNAETRKCIFINFLRHFPFEFYQFLPVSEFLTLTDQEQVLKTRLPSDAPIRKNHKKLGRGPEMVTRMLHAARWDNHQIFVLNTEWPNW